MRTILLLGLVGLIAGCATQKVWTATGGSRSDGIVRLSYEVKRFEKPVLDEEQGRTTAAQRCAIWGYEDAAAFGGITTNCQAYNAYGCVRATVTKEYQCIGTPSEKNRYEPVTAEDQSRSL